MVVRTGNDTEVLDAIEVNSAYTSAEAYGEAGDLYSLNLSVSGVKAATASNLLYQNTPNPISEFTLIGFDLAEAAQAKLVINDVNGRILLSRQLEGVQGYNSFRIEADQLGGASGVLSYTIVAGNFTATRQMVVVR